MENITNLKVDNLEYCTLEETLRLPASSARVSIAKLNINTQKSKTYPNTTLLINDVACKPKSLGPVVLTDGLLVKTFSNLESSKSAVKTDSGYYIPKGSKMIVCFMNCNINDGFLTNFL